MLRFAFALILFGMAASEAAAQEGNDFRTPFLPGLSDTGPEGAAIEWEKTPGPSRDARQTALATSLARAFGRGAMRIDVGRSILDVPGTQVPPFLARRSKMHLDWSHAVEERNRDFESVRERRLIIHGVAATRRNQRGDLDAEVKYLESLLESMAAQRVALTELRGRFERDLETIYNAISFPVISVGLVRDREMRDSRKVLEEAGAIARNAAEKEGQKRFGMAITDLSSAGSRLSSFWESASYSAHELVEVFEDYMVCKADPETNRITEHCGVVVTLCQVRPRLAEADGTRLDDGPGRPPAAYPNSITLSPSRGGSTTGTVDPLVNGLDGHFQEWVRSAFESKWREAEPFLVGATDREAEWKASVANFLGRLADIEDQIRRLDEKTAEMRQEVETRRRDIEALDRERCGECRKLEQENARESELKGRFQALLTERKLLLMLREREPFSSEGDAETRATRLANKILAKLERTAEMRYVEDVRRFLPKEHRFNEMSGTLFDQFACDRFAVLGTGITTIDPQTVQVAVAFECTARVNPRSFTDFETLRAVERRQSGMKPVSLPGMLGAVEDAALTIAIPPEPGPDGLPLYANWHDVQDLLKRLNAADPGRNWRLPGREEIIDLLRTGTTGECARFQEALRLTCGDDYWTADVPSAAEQEAAAEPLHHVVNFSLSRPANFRRTKGRSEAAQVILVGERRGTAPLSSPDASVCSGCAAGR